MWRFKNNCNKFTLYVILERPLICIRATLILVLFSGSSSAQKLYITSCSTAALFINIVATHGSLPTSWYPVWNIKYLLKNTLHTLRQLLTVLESLVWAALCYNSRHHARFVLSANWPTQCWPKSFNGQNSVWFGFRIATMTMIVKLIQLISISRVAHPFEAVIQKIWSKRLVNHSVL